MAEIDIKTGGSINCDWLEDERSKSVDWETGDRTCDLAICGRKPEGARAPGSSDDSTPC